jgi:hypothetical protein
MWQELTHGSNATCSTGVIYTTAGTCTNHASSADHNGRVAKQ